MYVNNITLSTYLAPRSIELNQKARTSWEFEACRTAFASLVLFLGPLGPVTIIEFQSRSDGTSCNAYL